MNSKILEVFLRCGADVNRHNELGNTALHYSMMIGDRIDKNIAVMTTLILAGAGLRALN